MQINFSNIFKELLLESVDNRQLLLESIQSTDITQLMDDRQVIAINYEDETADPSVKAGARYIEIYAFGLTNAKKPMPCVLAYMRGNVVSKTLFSGRPNDRVKWRIYRIDRITSWNKTNAKYSSDQKNMDEKRKKYNEAYRNLSQVFKFVPLEGTSTTPPTTGPVDNIPNNPNTTPSNDNNNSVDKNKDNNGNGGQEQQPNDNNNNNQKVNNTTTPSTDNKPTDNLPRPEVLNKDNNQDQNNDGVSDGVSDGTNDGDKPEEKPFNTVMSPKFDTLGGSLKSVGNIIKNKFKRK